MELPLNVPHGEQIHSLRNNEDIPVTYTKTVSYNFSPSALRRRDQLDLAMISVKGTSIMPFKIYVPPLISKHKAWDISTDAPKLKTIN